MHYVLASSFFLHSLRKVRDSEVETMQEKVFLCKTRQFDEF